MNSALTVPVDLREILRGLREGFHVLRKVCLPGIHLVTSEEELMPGATEPWRRVRAVFFDIRIVVCLAVFVDAHSTQRTVR